MRGNVGAHLFSTGAATMFAVLAYGWLNWNRSSALLVAAQLACPLVLLCLGAVMSRGERFSAPRCFVFVAVLLTLSPLPAAYFGGTGFGMKSMAAAGMAALGGLFLRGRRAWGGAGVACLICCLTIAAAWIGFWQSSGGRLLFSDDHPAFLYRLHQMKENFPSIPFWNPSWNGGVEAREFFPSGALGLFLIWWPIVASFDLLSAYNLIVLLTLFALIPAAIGLAGYHLTRDREAGWLSGSLGVTASLIWYRWALEYGTLPFLTATAMLALVVALNVRMQSADAEWRVSHSALLFVATSIACFWTLSVLALVPCFVVSWFLVANRIRRRHLAGVCAALAVVHLPWILLFLEASRVLSFLTASAPTAVGTHSVHAHAFALPAIQSYGVLKGSLLVAREFLGAVSPLVLILSIPAIVGLARRDRWMVCTMIGLALLLAVGGPILKPKLELQRFWLVTVIVLVPAVGAAVRNFLANESSPIIRTLLLMAICCAPIWLWRVSANKTMIQASFASREVFDLPAAIERHGGSGRTLFVGFILHELSAGHIAPLPLLTTKPMIASSYQHDRWKYTEIIPSELLTAGDVGVTKYLNAMNVTLIVAHEPKWKKWFRKRSAQYPELERVGRFVLFGRAGYIGNYVMTGEAELLEAVDNRVTVRMGGDSAVIKFAYLPILVSDRCELRPFSISETLSLVEIARCNSGSQVTISMRSPTQRLARILHLPYGQ